MRPITRGEPAFRFGWLTSEVAGQPTGNGLRRDSGPQFVLATEERMHYHFALAGRVRPATRS